MFLDTNQHHLHSLRLKLKNETKVIRKCREEGVQTVTVARKTVAAPIDSKTMTEKPLGGTISKTKIKKLDLMERLNLAKQEAILERKMDQLNEDILNRSKQETIDTTMKFLKKLPGISTTMSTEGNETSENLKRSSSTPATAGSSVDIDPNAAVNGNDSESFDNSMLGKTVVRSSKFTF
jgi:hypothetical protein